MVLGGDSDVFQRARQLELSRSDARAGGSRALFSSDGVADLVVDSVFISGMLQGKQRLKTLSRRPVISLSPGRSRDAGLAVWMCVPIMDH